MKKRMTIMVIALVIVFGGIIAFNLFKGFMIKRFFANYEPPAVTVSSVKAVRQNWEPRLPAVGNFLAINGVEVNSQAAPYGRGPNKVGRMRRMRLQSRALGRAGLDAVPNGAWRSRARRLGAHRCAG